MKLSRFFILISTTICYAALISLSPGCGRYDTDREASEIVLNYPADSTFFPPEIIPPVFHWKDTNTLSEEWKLLLKFRKSGKKLTYTTSVKKWKPDSAGWEEIKKYSSDKRALLEISGFSESRKDRVVSKGSVYFYTSKDSVGAPIFFREVNLPFEKAVTDPAKIRWKLGSISSRKKPGIVLQNLPVCGNCHSFSSDGKRLGLEVDSGNDKGAYAVIDIKKEIILDQSKIISWSDYRRQDNDPTFGLLCQLSPGGRYIAGTVKDQALAVYRSDLMFSQIFFLIKGLVAIYDHTTKNITALPGASDEKYCQTNATWSPDGKDIVFARSKSYDLYEFKKQRKALIGGPPAEKFLENQGRSYKYDLIKVPFNNGRGGEPVPIEGASQNGKSNYFAKYSHDGKWIVFCRADNYMLLQPDSKLYIIPAEGGKARKLKCNNSVLNSWHSWSPNNRWLVFSSKENGPYTQLWLTHIDKQGRSTPPVVLDNFTESDRAANIPEFVNNSSDAINKIHEDYLDAHSYYRIANNFHKCGDYYKAIPAYRKAIKWNPNNYFAYNNLGALLMETGKKDEAAECFQAAIDLGIDDEDHYQAHTNMAIYLSEKGEIEKAIKELEISNRLNPDKKIQKNIEKMKMKMKTGTRNAAD